MSLTLEVCDGRFLYAAAEKNSGSYGEMGERFWLSWDGEKLDCRQVEQRPESRESIPLLVNSSLTDAGIPIASARDSLWERAE